MIEKGHCCWRRRDDWFQSTFSFFSKLTQQKKLFPVPTAPSTTCIPLLFSKDRNIESLIAVDNLKHSVASIGTFRVINRRILVLNFFLKASWKKKRYDKMGTNWRGYIKSKYKISYSPKYILKWPLLVYFCYLCKPIMILGEVQELH